MLYNFRQAGGLLQNESRARVKRRSCDPCSVGRGLISRSRFMVPDSPLVLRLDAQQCCGPPDAANNWILSSPRSRGSRGRTVSPTSVWRTRRGGGKHRSLQLTKFVSRYAACQLCMLVGRWEGEDVGQSQPSPTCPYTLHNQLPFI